MRAADIPLKKAVAGVRVGLLPELGFVVNPTVQQMEDSSLDLIMAGTDGAVLMIEGFCDFLTEEQMLEVFAVPLLLFVLLVDLGDATVNLSFAHCIVSAALLLVVAVACSHCCSQPCLLAPALKNCSHANA